MTRITRRRPIHRPQLDESECFFKVGYINLDKRILYTPEDIIEYAREHNFINEGTCLDIKKLIEDNDELELSFEDIEEDGQIIYISDTKKYKIIINKNHPQNKQRFTMAHEYIHYQMDRDIVEYNAHTDTILYRDATTILDIDIRANRYASEILMPTKEFKQMMQQHKGNVLKVAEIFNVSTLAVRYRAEGLGLR